MFSHIENTKAHISSLLLGRFLSCARFLHCFHKFSIGFRSGELACQLSFFRPISSLQIFGAFNAHVLHLPSKSDLGSCHGDNRKFTKSFAVHLSGGIKIKYDFVELVIAPHTMIDDLPDLKLRTVQSHWYLS